MGYAHPMGIAYGYGKTMTFKFLLSDLALAAPAPEVTQR